MQEVGSYTCLFSRSTGRYHYRTIKKVSKWVFVKFRRILTFTYVEDFQDRTFGLQMSRCLGDVYLWAFSHFFRVCYGCFSSTISVLVLLNWVLAVPAICRWPPRICVSLRQYPWVFEIELVRVEDSIPWYVFAILLSPILIGELYIKITGKTPGEAVNEYLYGDVLRNLWGYDALHGKKNKKPFVHQILKASRQRGCLSHTLALASLWWR